tara:strand:+ start:1404 stop:1625 length:222 start_codon:yes stop_codon:yes gene_type:complete
MLGFSLKDSIWFIGIVVSLGVTWGMWSERLQAVEAKADSVFEMQKDIAVIKEKLEWMEQYIIKTYEDNSRINW